MFNIEFYSTADGVSELWDFLDDLQKKAVTNKDARIQHKQISQYIQLLEDHGTRLGENITKHLEDDIWELRPGIIGCCTSTIRMIPTSFSTSSARKRRKHLAAKLTKQKQSATIGLPERGDTIWQLGLTIKTMLGETNPEIGKDLDEVEAISQIVGTMIERRHDLQLSQRDLADLCGLPHSSVARIESGKSTPNLTTLLKIFRELGLNLVAEPSIRTAPPAR
jgi:DNA-binding XRE family transcriptional regulator